MMCNQRQGPVDDVLEIRFAGLISFMCSDVQLLRITQRKTCAIRKILFHYYLALTDYIETYFEKTSVYIYGTDFYSRAEI